MSLLPSPVLQCQRSTSEACVVSESCHPPLGLGVLEEFQVKQGTATTRESRQHGVPVLLSFVAVRKLHVDVLKRECLLAKLLEADNDVLLGRVDPALLLNKLGADGLELGVLEDTRGAGLLARALLDVDLVAGVNERLGGSWSQRRAVLERLGLRAKVKDGGRHLEDGADRSIGKGEGGLAMIVLWRRVSARSVRVN